MSNPIFVELMTLLSISVVAVVDKPSRRTVNSKKT